MITVRYFASIRETLGVDQDLLDTVEGCETVADVIGVIAARHGEKWQQAVNDRQLLMAVNQTMADTGASVSDGDEVAFFPPVTGG